MNRFKGKSETSKRGFIPRILDLDSDPLLDVVLEATVEYGTGCWLDTSRDPESQLVGQQVVWEHFNGPQNWENSFIYNTCSDYRICYNPHCLATMEVPYHETQR